ncbi:Thiosulfate sulfurtransferase rdl2, mitochondrial [Marasmius crinis-equi]|uniref:Thiosulfate sulfurtransferase rdl2, mitochondrial n=1 Tax=Marasmius crinis-equi TaxID=585013 RepID=A0ABR3FI50_9AGAR
MFRSSLARIARPVALSASRSPRLVSPRVQSVRWQTTQTPPTKSNASSKKADDKDWDGRILTYNQLKPKTRSPSPDAYLIDVREPDEVIQGMIPSAVNLPLSILAESLDTPAEVFQTKHGFPKPQKDQEVTFYCRSGKRSASASDIAKRHGYSNIYNYEGSWLEWVSKEGKKD